MLMLASIGVSISKHYCHGYLISSSLFGTAKQCCESNCNACHNETIFNKGTDSYVGSVYEPVKASQIKLFNAVPVVFTIPSQDLNNYYSQLHAILKAPPPLIKQSSLQEYLGVFRC
jgi:hypothetical protein